MQDKVRELFARGNYLDEIGEAHIFPTNSHPIDTTYPKLDSDICRSCEARIFPQCDVRLPNGEPR